MLRFTSRDVLWLTVVVGLALGWCVDHVSIRRDAVARIEAAELETDTLHDGNADMMAAIYDAGVRVHKQANGRYSVRIIPVRSLDPLHQPAGDAPFQRGIAP